MGGFDFVGVTREQGTKITLITRSRWQKRVEETDAPERYVAAAMKDRQ
jgi:hypothetical protein